MNSESNKNISSRKDVHLRIPTKNVTTNTRPVVTKQSGNLPDKIKDKVVSTPNNTDIKTSLNETENKLNSVLKTEQQKYLHLKKKIKARKKAERNEKIKTILVASSLGLIVTSVIILIFIFGYYRSITKYSQEKSHFSISGYEYIDERDTSEKNQKKIEDRKTNKESPVLVLSDSIITIDSNAFIPYSLISDYFNLSVAGDNYHRTIIVGSAETDFDGLNTAVFNFGSNEIDVNGSPQILSSKSFISNGEFYIPLEFIETYIKGIKIDKSINKNKTKISITKTNENIYFGGSTNTPLDSPNISNYTSDTQAIHKYTVDVSRFEKYINPADTDKYLILVNINNKLPSNYVPEDLVYVKTTKSRPTQQMSNDAAMALTAMLLAADAAGYNDLAVSSGYRSYSYQNSLFNQKKDSYLKNYTEAEAEAKAAESIMYPGASEHQSGLCADVHNGSTTMQTFANEDAYKWLLEHCADFGFILRYPQSEESITGVKFEPWHFRFVGRFHAQKIMSSGLSLEEYLEKYSEKSK